MVSHLDATTPKVASHSKWLSTARCRLTDKDYQDFRAAVKVLFTHGSGKQVADEEGGAEVPTAKEQGMFLTSLMGEAKIETKELTSLNAATHQPAISDPDRALHYKLVLAGGPKQTSKELLDEELWVPTEGQLSLLEEVCETMLYKKDENDELLGDWKEMWANQVEVDAQPCRSAATGVSELPSVDDVLWQLAELLWRADFPEGIEEHRRFMEGFCLSLPKLLIPTWEHHIAESAPAGAEEPGSGLCL
ncbi:hypothetical protein AK812_SmicGene10070 [Symbiodinium microadriaticum]|uniref:Uncharacterized protein n=1 Tax=Symbiodinium microadriaticum TaxID=2951 RepID=A0A1Q9EGT2_SYMMI|nr:hypothetical protein AK812_SmicGene10070 [Symbiodinium microadriaticum]